MNGERIASARNPLVQELARLKTARGRKETGLMPVEGEKMLLEALRAGLRPEVLLYDEERAGALAGLIAMFRCDAHPVPAGVLARCADTVTPQGCLAAFHIPPETAPEALGGRIVALDGVQDPGNCGTIWRTADAAGFTGILFGGGCADPMSGKVQRATMGSGFRLPYARADRLSGALRVLKESGRRILVSALGEKDVYRREARPGPFVLVIGSEARGVGEEVRDLADERLMLPMRGGAESLNAAVAAGVLMYELTRPGGQNSAGE